MENDNVNVINCRNTLSSSRCFRNSVDVDILETAKILLLKMI